MLKQQKRYKMDNKSGTTEGDKYIQQPRCFSGEDYDKLKVMIKDNFSDLTDDDRTQILYFIDAHFYWNV